MKLFETLHCKSRAHCRGCLSSKTLRKKWKAIGLADRLDFDCPEGFTLENLPPRRTAPDRGRETGRLQQSLLRRALGINDCPGCGEVVIRRIGFRILDNKLEEGRCGACRRAIPGVWS